MVAGTAAGSRLFPVRTPTRLESQVHESILQPFFHWDAVYYRAIWLHGYMQAVNSIDVAHRSGFFPLYPILVRVLGLGDSGFDWAAIVLPNLAFLLALIVIYQLARHYLDERPAALATWVLALWPWACFYAYPYPESLELLFIALTLWLLDRRRELLAGLVGGLAAFTRPTGVTVVAAFASVIPELGRLSDFHGFAGRLEGSRWRVDPAILHTVVAALIVALGLLASVAVLLVQTGDPLGYVHGQAFWVAHRRNLLFPIGALVRLAGQHRLYQNEGLGVAVCLAFFATLLWALRRLPLRYGLFGAAFLAMTSLSAWLFVHSFVSFPRHSLQWFPAYFAFAVLLSRPRLRWLTPLWLATSCLVLFLLSGLYATWHFVG